MRIIHPSPGLAVPVLCLLSVAVLMQGCPSKALPPGVRFPITSGSHTILPNAQQRILIWGNPPLADVAVEWLRSHHYSSILIPEKGPFHTPQASHSFSDRKAALAVAENMKAEFVLFLEREESKEGALIEQQCDSFSYVNVSLRGLSVESGETVLRGSAHYPHCVDPGGETFQNLT